MPAWPLGVTYTKGLLGIDQRAIVAESLKEARSIAQRWTERIETADFEDIQADPRLMAIVRQTGRTLFGDNCAVCHGAMPRAARAFPNLTTASWLWGGDPETIAETIRVGINSAHPDTRVAQMLAFGRDQMLARGDVENVVAYVQSLVRTRGGKRCPAQRLEAGKAVVRRQLRRPATARTARGRSISARRT